MPLCDRCNGLILSIPKTTYQIPPRHVDIDLKDASLDDFHQVSAWSSSSSTSKSRFFDDVDVRAIRIPSAANPREWTTLKKSGVAGFALLAAFTATIGTPLYIAAIPSIQSQFTLSLTISILPASLYALSLGIGCLLCTSFSESLFGRRPIYLLVLPSSLLFTVLASTAPTFAYLAVSKTLAGLFSGPCLTVGVGVLNDLWDVSLDRVGSLFAVLFVVTVIWATQVGPMVSAAVMQEGRGWDWTFHVSSILLVFCIVAAWLVPETYVPAIQRTVALRRGCHLRSRLSWGVISRGVGRPLHMLVVEAIIFPTGLVLAITQSVVFAYYVAYAALFEKVYGFTQYQVGLAFSPLLVGTCLAVPVVVAFDKWTYQPARSKARKNGTVVPPEMRLYPAMLGSVTLPTSLFWLAWTGRPQIHWIVPVLSGTLFGFSYVLNMLCLPIYNNDVYTTHYGASVLAASTFMRFVISSSFLLFTSHIIDRLGFAWAVSLLGFVTVALIPIPWVFFKWGPSLRARSVYLKTF